MIKNKTKLMATCALILLTNNSALAEKTSDVYVKAQVGQIHLNDTKNFNGNNQNSYPTPYFCAGIGVDLDDTWRLELEIEHNKINFSKNTKLLALNTSSYNLQNVTIDNASITLYKDIYNINDNTKIFLGAGVGRSQMNEKIQQSFVLMDKKRNLQTHEEEFIRNKFYKLSYNLNLGLSHKIDSNTNIEINYKYKDYGKVKKKVLSDNHIKRQKYKAHMFTTGIRYNF